MTTRAVKCKYGTSCYRQNPQHFIEFSHPWKDEKRKRDINQTNCVSESSSATKRVKKSVSSSDFGFYLSKVRGIQEAHNEFQSVSIEDILSTCGGKLKQSIQFNYMFDIDWLVTRYPPECRNLPLFIVHQEKGSTRSELEQHIVNYPNIQLIGAHLMDVYGTHHTKMMILHQNDGLRVIIHTANLISGDWDQKTQGVWMSPLFPPSVTSSFIDSSKTNFQTDLLEYLASYHSSEINKWCDLIKKYDMSSAKVFLIGSIPGRHSGDNKHKFGHLKLKSVLSKCGLSREINNDWPVIAQFSSIGTLGSSPEQWLTGQFLHSLKTTSVSEPLNSGTELKLIFPCVEDVRNSLEGYSAGGSLPYNDSVAKKQEYLKSFMHRWKSSCRGRDKASPHIKSYVRISPTMDKIGWFMLTSANLSKAAWGTMEKNGIQLAIRSYELGVLFVPNLFGSEQIFKVHRDCLNSDAVNEPLLFALPFDVPLTSYTNEDEPWICNIAYTCTPDTRGNVWLP